MSIPYRELATGVHLVGPSGPLNSGQTEALMHTFKELSAHGVRRVIVALDDVPFIDGPGLAALIAGFRLFWNDGGDYRLVGAQDQPKLVFELTGFDHVFQISDSLTETLEFSVPVQAQPGFRFRAPAPHVTLAV